jgi:hypothetical protein
VDVAREPGHWVLESRPAAAEARFAFAGVSDLLAGVLAEVLDALPTPQADALRVALPRRGRAAERAGGCGRGSQRTAGVVRRPPDAVDSG